MQVLDCRGVVARKALHVPQIRQSASFSQLIAGAARSLESDVVELDCLVILSIATQKSVQSGRDCDRDAGTSVRAGVFDRSVKIRDFHIHPVGRVPPTAKLPNVPWLS